ncbi:integrase domain-containing protein [Deferribacter abyssi]|uniref:integrase domain-containing protein n=1 Tax=Deferribacter abyssi TaxID=213806 RepID=UPI003C130859
MKVKLKRNFIGEKDLSRKPAAFRLAKEVVRSGNEGTIKKTVTAIRKLAKFAKEELELKNLAKLHPEHMKEFAQYLRDEVGDGDISKAHAANIISSLNRIFDHYGQDTLKLSAEAEGLNRGTRYYNIDRSVNYNLHKQFTNYLTEKFISTGDHRFEALRIQVEMEREFGLRFKESALHDAKGIHKRDHLLDVVKGTKGGQPRQVPIRDEKGYELLSYAKNLKNEFGYTKSLIPDDYSFNKWQNFAYNVVKDFNERFNCNYHFHGERHAYAQNRYLELTGFDAPVVSGFTNGSYLEVMAEYYQISIDEAKDLDYEARMIISEELGHHRIDVTNYYLGK